MLTFYEEIMVLLLHDENGTFLPVSEHTLNRALTGAVLMDLAFANRTMKKIRENPRAAERDLGRASANKFGSPLADLTAAARPIVDSFSGSRISMAKTRRTGDRGQL